MDTTELRQAIVAAFSSVPRPERNNIAPHKCPECDELADDFPSFDALSIPDSIFEKHLWDLSLLSAEAKHYFLPTWLLRGINIEGPWLPDQCEVVLLGLGSVEHRWSPAPPYTKIQWQVIKEWIEHIEGFSDDIDMEMIEKALVRVSNECAGSG